MTELFATKPACSVDGCLRQVLSRGLCGSHYARERYRANLTENRRIANAYYHRRKGEPGTKERRRETVLKMQFGIGASEYDALLAAQEGCCAICRGPETAMRNGKVKALAVDHCHATGEVRGLLCQLCNTMLGNARDSTDRLRAGIAYLDASGRG